MKSTIPHNIDQLDLQAINLSKPTPIKSNRRNVRVTRRDFFQNKPLKPNIFQPSQTQYLTLNIKASKQEQQHNQQSPPYNRNRHHNRHHKSVDLYRRSDRKNRRSLQKSQQIQKSHKQQAQQYPNKTHQNNFIFQQSDQQQQNIINKQLNLEAINMNHNCNKQPQNKQKIRNIFDIDFDDKDKDDDNQYNGYREQQKSISSQRLSQSNKYSNRKQSFRQKFNSIQNKNNQKQVQYRNQSLKTKRRRRFRKMQNITEQSSQSIEPNASETSSNIQKMLKSSPKITNNSNINMKNIEQIGSKKHNQTLLPKKGKALINTFKRMKIFREKNWNVEKYWLQTQNTHNFLYTAYVQSKDVYIYNRKGNYKLGDPYLIKMQTNFMGTIINFYTSGISYRNASSSKGNQKIRQIFATVQTQSVNFFDEVRPRQFKIYFFKKIVDLDKLPQYLKERPLNQLYTQSQHCQKYINCYQNKKPKWDQQQKVHVLDMYNRAEQASVKNFILLDNHGRQCLVFGKSSKNIFNMDCHQQFPQILAFAFSLTSFLFKNW